VADNGKGAAPEANAPALEEWIVTKLKYTVTQHAITKLTKVASKLHPALTAGTTYWIILSPTGYDGSTIWYYNTVIQGSALLSFDDGRTWPSSGAVSPAFDVWEQ
jgi:hypothetical protein